MDELLKVYEHRISCKIWVTTQCTLRCNYCYENANQNSNKAAMLTTDQADAIIHIIKYNLDRIDRVRFHGGEPLLNIEMIEYIVSKLFKAKPDLKFELTTNGMVWNESIEQFFTHYHDNFEGGISISIDGNEYTHDLNRKNKAGKGSFESVMATFHSLQNIFDKIEARMTISPETAGSIYDNVVFLNDMGFTTIRHGFDYFNTSWTNEDLDRIKEEYVKINQRFQPMEEKRISFVDKLRMRYRREEQGYCIPVLNFYIDGRIYPCSYCVGDTKYEIGDFQSGIDFEKIARLRKELLCNDYELCKTCSNKMRCNNNRCKFRNMCITQDAIKLSEMNCAMENLEAELALRYQHQPEYYV